MTERTPSNHVYLGTPPTPHDKDLPSLMEQLMSDASNANILHDKKSIRKERKGAKNASFGMKKGFLNSSKSTKNKTSQAVEKRDLTNHTDIFELDSVGNMHSSLEIGIKREFQMKLQFPEVQSAQHNPYVTSELLDILSNHPKISVGLKNKKFIAAIEAMNDRPKETMERLKDQKDVMEFLGDYCRVMGEYFSQRTADEIEKKRNGKPLGPLVEEVETKDNSQTQPGQAKRLGIEKKKKNGQKMAPLVEEFEGKGRQLNNKEQDEVNTILQNDQLRSLLLDPKLQDIVKECSNPAKLRKYMVDTEYSPKLRRMMDAGLLKVV